MTLRLIPLLSLVPALAVLAPVQALAEGLTYFEDPVYQLLSPGDHHPMDDMVLYAEAGDTRAQFILGDMYAKGKGGFAKNEAKSREWFEMAARNGENFSFIRLAALARHHKNWTEVYQWYTLALSNMPYGAAERKWVAAERDKLEQEKKVTSDDIKSAKKAADAWTEKSKELLKADLELQKRKEPEAEALALQDKLEPEAAAAPAKAPKTAKETPAAAPKEPVKEEPVKEEKKADAPQDAPAAEAKADEKAAVKDETQKEEPKKEDVKTEETKPSEGESKK